MKEVEPLDVDGNVNNKNITMPNPKVKDMPRQQQKAVKASMAERAAMKMVKKSSALKKISAACKAAAKRKFKVWPSAYASGWGVRCTRAGGPSKFGGGKKKK